MTLAEFLQFLGIASSLITMGAIPIIIAKMNKQNKHDNEHNHKLLELQEAENELTKYSRKMSRETAEAVLTGKCNGELTAAIKNYDDAKDELIRKKDQAISELKSL